MQCRQVHYFLYSYSISVITPYTPLEGLCLILKHNLTQTNYERLRMEAKNRGADIYPSYTRIKEVKKVCQINPELMQHPSAEEFLVPMQACLEHQLFRIVDDELQARMEAYAVDPDNMFFFHFKYGGDGAGDNAEYRSDIDQHSIFASYLVPLELIVVNQRSKKRAHFYVNRMANSWTAVVYLRIAFERETKSKSCCLSECFSKDRKRLKA